MSRALPPAAYLVGRFVRRGRFAIGSGYRGRGLGGTSRAPGSIDVYSRAPGVCVSSYS